MWPSNKSTIKGFPQMQQNSFVHQESKEKVHKDIFNQEIAFFHLSFPH